MEVSRYRWRSAFILLVAPCAALCFSVPGPAQDLVDSPAAAQSKQATPQVDCFGDQLPTGAKLRLGTIRLRSGHSVEGVAFSPDGKYVVSTGWENSIRFWDVKTGELARRLVIDDQDEGTFAVAFSPDGTKLASVGERGFVRLWDLKTGTVISKVLGHVERTFGVRVYGVAFAPDGLTFATGGDDKTVRLWDSTTGTQLLELPSDEGGGDARPVAYSPDGNLFASGNSKGTIQIWNLAEGREVKTIPKAHERDVTSLAFTKDGKLLISSGTHLERTGKQSVRSISEIHAWNVADGEKQPGFDPKEKLLGDTTIAISQDGQFLASSHYEKVVVWDVNARTPIRTIDGEQEYFGGRSHNLAISPDNRLVAAGTFGAGTNKVYLWDLATGEPVLPQSDCHTEAVLAMDLSPDGSLIATGSADGTVRLWDAETGEHVRLIDKGSGWVRYVEFFHDGKMIALGRETHSPNKPQFEGEVKICQVADGKVSQHFPVPDRVMCGALSSDSKQLAVGIGLGDMMPLDPGAGPAECKILVWETQSGNKVSEMVGPKGRFLQVHFAPMGDELWTTSEGDSVRKWSIKDGKEIESARSSPATTRRHAWPLIIPGASRVALRELERIERGVSRGKLSVRAINSDKSEWEKQFPDTWPREFAVSADGKLLAAFLYPLSGSQAQKRIAIFSAAEGQELLSFKLEDGSVRSLAFSSDGTLLMSGMEASDALVWVVSGADKALRQSGQ
jgi:WD40 repeat protein